MVVRIAFTQEALALNVVSKVKPPISTFGRERPVTAASPSLSRDPARPWSISRIARTDLATLVTLLKSPENILSEFGLMINTFQDHHIR